MSKKNAQKAKKQRFQRFMILIIAMAVLAWLLMMNTGNTQPIKWVQHPKQTPFGFAPRTDTCEVPLCESMIVENWYDYHRALVVQFDMYAKAKDNSQYLLYDQVKTHHSQIKDMIRSTIGGVHPSEIRDPELLVVKNQVAQCMKRIVGDEMVDKILVPVWNSYKVYQ